jgi:hypothetical protein
MHYATQVADSGTQGAHMLVQSYNRDKQQWIYPPPIRLGYIYLVAAVMKLSGASPERAAVSVSSIFSVMGFFVVALLGLRFFDRWAVLVGLALLSVSPIDLAIARRAWQDSVWGCIGVFFFYLCMEASVSSRPKLCRICFWVVAAYYLTIKESALLVYGVCTVWLVGSAWLRERSLQKCLRIALMSVVVVAASFVVLAWYSGGAFPAVEAIQHSVQSRAWNEYAHLYQRGPWHSFLTAFWMMSPITTLFCIVGIATVTWSRNLRPVASGLGTRQRQIGWAMVYLIGTLVFAMTVAPDCKNLRYTTILFGPICLLAGLGIVRLLTLAKYDLGISGYRSALCGVVILLGLTGLTDYRRFKRVFVQYALDDLAIVRVINYAFAAGSGAEKTPLEVMASSGVFADRPLVATPSISPGYYLSLSKRFYDQGAYGDAVKAADNAVKLKPDYSEAWNSICAAYNKLGRYEEAAAACEQALRYKPDFELARNNLQYAREMAMAAGK